MKIKDRTDFAAGLTFIVIGGGAAAIAASYPMGSPTQMGPGYFPLLLGALLTLLGVIGVVGSLTGRPSADDWPEWNWKILIQITLSVALFALTIEPLGLVISLFLVIIVSAFASHEFTWRYAIGTAVVLTIFSVGLFSYALGLPIPLRPSFFSF